MEVKLRDKPEIPVLEIDAKHLVDRQFSLTTMLGEADTNPACVREGGFRDRENYKKGYNL